MTAQKIQSMPVTQGIRTMNEPFFFFLGTLLDLVSLGAAVLSAAWLSQLLDPEVVSRGDTITLGIAAESRDSLAG